MVADPGQAQRLGNTRHEFGGRLGIAAGKQGHIMALTHEFLGQPGHHPLGAAVEFGGNSLGQGGNLCDPHHNISVAAGLRSCRIGQRSIVVTVPELRQRAQMFRPAAEETFTGSI